MPNHGAFWPKAPVSGMKKENIDPMTVVPSMVSFQPTCPQQVLPSGMNISATSACASVPLTKVQLWAASAQISEPLGARIVSYCGNPPCNGFSEKKRAVDGVADTRSQLPG